MIKIYEEDNDYVCELWGGSTKHPDDKYYFSDWQDKTNIMPAKEQIFQWLLWIASKRMWPFHAKEITEYALKNWYLWDKEDA